MNDGVCRTLIDVQHVSDLKNLIPLNILDSNRCNVRMENKSMRIVKGALVVTKTMKVENL